MCSLASGVLPERTSWKFSRITVTVALEDESESKIRPFWKPKELFLSYLEPQTQKYKMSLFHRNKGHCHGQRREMRGRMGGAELIVFFRRVF